MLIERLLSSPGTRPRLRVALLLDAGSAEQPWVALEHLLACDFASPVVVVHERAVGGERAPEALPRPGAPDGAAAGQEVAVAARCRHPPCGSGALVGRADLAARLAAIPSLSADPVRTGDGVAYPDELVGWMRPYAIDVALRLSGGRPLKGSALEVARYGVWSYQVGNGRSRLGRFASLLQGGRVSCVWLQVDLARRAAPLVLAKGYTSVAGEGSDGQDTVSAKPLLLGSTFFIRKLKDLHEHGFARLEADAAPTAPPSAAGTRADGRPRSATDGVRSVAPRVLRRAEERLLRPLRHLRWSMAVRIDGSPRYVEGGAFDLRGFRWIEPPPGRAYADPHLLERGGRTYCFFEDLDQERRVGRISCGVVARDGRLEEIVPTLVRPYHLSYPFVFEDDGEVFMVPESRKNNAVDLYRAVSFPERWEKVTTLLEGPGLDTTVLRHGGVYWFFIAVREPDGASEQLLLFFSRSLTGPLRLHPRSPINLDIRSCRPAGAILVRDGRLVRPSQDCSVTYGYQIQFNEILVLTPDEYAERPTLTVPPPAGMEGVHTYNRCGRVEVLDGKRYEWNAIARRASGPERARR